MFFRGYPGRELPFPRPFFRNEPGAGGEFSFLLSIPAILGALVLQLKDAGSLFGSVSAGVVVSGMISAFVVGLVSLKILIKLVKKGNLYYFSFYLIPFGIAGLIFY